MTYKHGRLLFRGIIFALFFVLFLVGTGPKFYSKLPTGGSPLLFIATLLSWTASWIAGIVAVLFIIGCIWRRRLFCRFFCPLGCIFDVLIKNREGFFSEKVARRASHQCRWIGVTLLVLIILGLAFPPLRTGIFLELDPLVLFGSIFQKTNILVFSVLALCILSVIHPWFWCGNVCPLGALQNLLFLKGYKRNKVLKEKLESTSTEVVEPPEGPQPRRHFFIASVAALTGFVLLAPLAGIRELYGSIKKRLLPPGALKEPRFSQVCTSCGRCIKACPTNFIVSESSLESWSGIRIGTMQFTNSCPVINPGKAYCEKECNLCSRVCPTGAIRPFSVEDKTKLKIATVEFNLDKCILSFQKECSICGRECQYEAIRFVWNQEVYANVPTVDADICTGCGRCIVFCPGIDSFLDPDTKFTPQTSKVKGLILKLEDDDTAAEDSTTDSTKAKKNP